MTAAGRWDPYQSVTTKQAPWSMFLERTSKRIDAIDRDITILLNKNISQTAQADREIKSLEERLQAPDARISLLEGASQGKETQLADLTRRVHLLNVKLMAQVKSRNMETKRRNEEASQRKQIVEDMGKAFTAKLDLLKAAPTRQKDSSAQAPKTEPAPAPSKPKKKKSEEDLDALLKEVVWSEKPAAKPRPEKTPKNVRVEKISPDDSLAKQLEDWEKHPNDFLLIECDAETRRQTDRTSDQILQEAAKGGSFDAYLSSLEEDNKFLVLANRRTGRATSFLNIRQIKPELLLLGLIKKDQPRMTG